MNWRKIRSRNKTTILFRKEKTMKVIGETNDGYILQASKEEIANLQGLYSQYSEGFRVNVEDEINITPFYRMAKNANSLRSKSDELRSAANYIDSAIRIIDFVTKATQET